MAQMIRRTNGRKAKAEYVRHLRTLTGNAATGRDDDDVDLYRLVDGTEIECISPAGDCRVMPREVKSTSDGYPGHLPGE